DLLLDRPRPGVAFATGLDRRDRDVAGIDRIGDVVAVDALRLRVAPVAEARVRQPAARDPHRRDGPPAGVARDLVAGVADADLEQLVGDAVGLLLRERERDAPLGLARLSDPAQQPFARDAERFLEAVLHAVQREARVELGDHRRRLG